MRDAGGGGANGGALCRVGHLEPPPGPRSVLRAPPGPGPPDGPADAPRFTGVTPHPCPAPCPAPRVPVCAPLPPPVPASPISRRTHAEQPRPVRALQPRPPGKLVHLLVPPFCLLRPPRCDETGGELEPGQVARPPLCLSAGPKCALLPLEGLAGFCPNVSWALESSNKRSVLNSRLVCSFIHGCIHTRNSCRMLASCQAPCQSSRSSNAQAARALASQR